MRNVKPWTRHYLGVHRSQSRVSGVAVLATALSVIGTASCGSDSPADATTNVDDAGGNDATGGAGGTPGTGGSGGTGETGGSGGTGETGGSGGTSLGGAGGASGTGGTGGAGGAGGTGAAGGAGGAAGIGGSGGSGGSGGTGGTTWPPECSVCHGATTNPAPPKDLWGNADPLSPGVGAHQSHLGPSTWHHEFECAECHVVPTDSGWDPGIPTHLNGINDLVWGPIAREGIYDAASSTCSGSYCHGGSLEDDAPGPSSNRIPSWTTVDGSQASCGVSCHTLPPGGGHPAATACESCHAEVIASFSAGGPPSVAWADPSRHIDGKLDVTGLTCTGCHGDPATNNPAPPQGTNGETSATEAAVGAHAEHLAPSNWHRQGQCSDCHTTPGAIAHADGTVDFSWGGPSNTGNPGPSYTAANTTCTNTYCHGATLDGPSAGGAVRRSPVWTQVDDTFDACGTTCHTNPPGGAHPAANTCEMCHGQVISTYDSTTASATWASADKHVNGVVESDRVHDLPQWTAPEKQSQHHGTAYFISNQRRDEHGTGCADCHGAELDGGSAGVSCNNTACHGGQDWKSCTFCHGANSAQTYPPAGILGETTTDTLAVGRHLAHLTAGSSHVAFTCSTCHGIPGAGDIDHALGYIPSTSLAVAGHHGDVLFNGVATGMTFNVTAIQGSPATARGTCLMACHSDGRGNAPNVTPYWAGGSWAPGDCGACHDASPTTNEHGRHHGAGGCETCHPAVTGDSHVNGIRDVRGFMTGPKGGGVAAISPGGGGPGAPCGNRWMCNGMCHGNGGSEFHNKYCW